MTGRDEVFFLIGVAVGAIVMLGITQAKADESLWISTPTTSLSFQAQREPPVVTIHPDGNVTIRPDLTLDEASRKFWDAVRQPRLRAAR